MPKEEFEGGKFYAVTLDGIEEVGALDAPDLWIGRRVADYDVPLPAGAAVGNCTRCSERVVYNPNRPVKAPRICMQCAGIEPLPFT